MKTDVIRITKDKDNLEGILHEAKKISAYVGLDNKRTMRLRLMAEELLGMLKELAQDFEGKFWIENDGMNFTLTTKLRTYDDMDQTIKQNLIAVSSDQKNAAAHGIMGKIRDVVENVLYPKDSAYNTRDIAYRLETDVMLGGDPHDSWSLKDYKKAQKDNTEPWDELEKSIIANLADDVTVSVKGRAVQIIITKCFEEEQAK